MNNIFSLLLALVSVVSYAQGIKWLSFDEALEAQKKAPKKIFVDVYAPWCGPCKMVEKTTFQHPEIIKLINENYYAVKFNGEGNEVVHYKGQVFSNPNHRPNLSGRNSIHEFSRYLNISAYPTLVFLDEKGAFITSLMGAFSAKEIEPYLTFIYTDTYKKVTTREQWESYQQKFRSKIKN